MELEATSSRTGIRDLAWFCVRVSLNASIHWQVSVNLTYQHPSITDNPIVECNLVNLFLFYLLHVSCKASRASRRLVAFLSGGFVRVDRFGSAKPVSELGPSDSPRLLLGSVRLTFLCETAFNLRQRSFSDVSSLILSSASIVSNLDVTLTSVRVVVCDEIESLSLDDSSRWRTWCRDFFGKILIY